MLGIHTTIETNGFYGDRLSDTELANIDLVILDMKAFHPEQHRRVTGVPDNAKVIAFCRRLSSLGHSMWLRYVLVARSHRLADEMTQIAQFAASLGVVKRVPLLRFTRWAASSGRSSGSTTS